MPSGLQFFPTFAHPSFAMINGSSFRTMTCVMQKYRPVWYALSIYPYMSDTLQSVKYLRENDEDAIRWTNDVVLTKRNQAINQENWIYT